MQYLSNTQTFQKRFHEQQKHFIYCLIQRHLFMNKVQHILFKYQLSVGIYVVVYSGYGKHCTQFFFFNKSAKMSTILCFSVNMGCCVYIEEKNELK